MKDPAGCPGLDPVRGLVMIRADAQDVGSGSESMAAAVEGEEASIALAMKLLEEDKQMLEEEARKEVEEKQELRKKRRSKQMQAVQREVAELRVSVEIAEAVGPHQFAVGVAGGVEKVQKTPDQL